MNTINVRSLRNENHRKYFADKLKNELKGITFIQETHGIDTDKELWEKEFNGKLFMSNDCKKKRGSAILISNDIEYNLLDFYKDNEGRIALVKIEFMKENYVLGSIYSPTKNEEKQQIKTLNTLIDQLTNYAETSIIIGGDFNVAINPVLDKEGGAEVHGQSVEYRKKLKAFLDTFNFTDSYRNKNPNKNLHTWRSSFHKTKTRLDYIFLSGNNENKLIKSKKIAMNYTDHDLVNYKLKVNIVKKGKGLWKFNANLLKEYDYVEGVKKIIEETKNENKKLGDKGLLWDLTKMNIRAYTIKYAAKIKKEENTIETELKTKLNQLINENTESVQIEQIDIIKKELENIDRIKFNGAKLRSKIKWAEEGEKNTAFFLNLEKHNSENRSISQLKISPKETITDFDRVQEELKTFYKQLYTQPPVDAHVNELENEFLNDIPKLEEEDLIKCEGLIKHHECLKALKDFKNNKSPGSDGFTAEFYKFFWINIKNLVIDSFNYGFASGQLSIDQKRGIISLIPKKDRDRLIIKNWRPITLLNTDYKILTKTLANRIKTVIAKLINEDQTGYVKGRYIGENIRTVKDVIEYLKNTKQEGLILLIDFEKAFDTVSWSLMIKTLKKFNFGKDFVKWIQVVYNNTQSTILNQGHFTEFFNLERGVRQGCPLSAYLFILIAEIMSCKIRNQKNIAGIKIKNRELKISQLADDTSIFLSDENCIPPLLEVLEKFRICSGLKTNVEKTKGYKIGGKGKPNKTYNILWPKEDIELLGLTISDDKKVNYEKNFEPKLEKMRNIIRMWNTRNLSIKGKITVVNALIISLFVYPITILDTPKEILKEIEKTVLDFIWNKKSPKIAKKVLQNQIKDGGLKLPNIYEKEKAWKMTWIQRAIKNPEKFWVLLLDMQTPNIKFIDLLKIHKPPNQLTNGLPIFYKEILGYWNSIQWKDINTPEGIANETIWYNKMITTKGKTLFWKHWYTKGICKIKDILNIHGQFLSHDELNKKYDLKCTFLEVLNIRHTIPIAWREHLGNCLTIGKQIDYPVKSKDIIKNGAEIESKEFYWIYIEKLKGIPACIKKWNEDTDAPNDWEAIFLHPFTNHTETKLQSFQYKILHRIIACNSWLKQINVIDSDKCNYCEQTDNLAHFFIHCKNTDNLWHKIVKWLEDTLECNLAVTHRDIIFGYTGENPNKEIINYCIILAKYYIYSVKVKNKENDLSILNYLMMVKKEFLIKYEAACIKDKREDFEFKWYALVRELL